MDLSGKLFQQLEEQTGQGKNGMWKKRNFVIETADRYPKKICFTAWGEQADQIMGIKGGAEVKVYFDLESREYNGKWYTDAKAWKIESGAGTSDGFSTPEPAFDEAGTLPPPSEKDDLPF